MTKQKRLLLMSCLVAGLIVLLIIGAGGWFFYGDSIREYLNRQRFDAAAWKSDCCWTNYARIRMVDDLLSRYSFWGMARNQVTDIIGPPDKTGYFRNWDMVYWLGPERGYFSIDSEWLVLRLDNQQKVSEYRIVRD